MPPEAVRYCGRLFSEQELQLIRTIIAEDSSRHRFALSQVCANGSTGGVPTDN